MSTSSPPPSSVTPPAPASTVSVPSSSIPTATNVPSPIGGASPNATSVGTGTVPQQTHCPLTPVTPTSRFANNSVSAVGSLAVEIRSRTKLPWNETLTAPETFKLIGCITQLAARGMRSGHVDWWCPKLSPVSPDATLTQGSTLAWTHYSSDQPSLLPFANRHVRFDPPATRPACPVPDGPPPRSEPLTTDSVHKDCATCPKDKTMIQSTDAVDSSSWQLHGCIEVAAQKYCSWFQFHKDMTCLAADKVRELVPFTITCEANDKMHDKEVIAGLLNKGTYDRPTKVGAEAGSAVSVVPSQTSSPADANADAAGSTGMGAMAMTALIVVPLVGIAFLAAAAIVYRRRQARFTRRLSNPHAPVRVRRASLTCMPAAAVVAVNCVEMSPPPPASPPTTTPAKHPRVFPNLTLHAFPRAPAAHITSIDRDVSLQSLTDAWHSLFLALERSATTHARASLPADVPVARMRAARAEYMSAVMAHAWQVLRGHEAVPANAAVGELAMGMRDVLVRTARVYPGFRLAWPEVGREVRHEAASVYFEHEVEGQGAGKVVRGVVYPGWVDEDRGVVVVKAKVVV